MKFLIVSFALAAVASAQYETVYKSAGNPRSAAILKQAADLQPDGSYSFNYETENGIAAGEAGTVKGIGPNGEAVHDVEGGFQYVGDDGQTYAVKYTAGPQGFVASGAHLPVAPPIPEAILRSLAYNAAHPEKETEYYKPEVKSYYTPQIAVTPTPIYSGQYETAKPAFYSSVRPTYQPALAVFSPTPAPIQPFVFNKQAAHFNPAGLH